MIRRFLGFLFLLVCASSTVHAQIRVELSIKHRLHMMYEPLLATVNIVNLSGRDVPLSDDGPQRWFGFQVLREDGQPVPPLDANYQLQPMIIPAGQSARRTVNLNTLFPVHDLGLYRIRAAIYFVPYRKYFQSQEVNVEISDGRTIWTQTVGVPDGQEGAGGTRRISMLTFRQEDAAVLYARVEDDEHGLVLCTYPLGKMIEGAKPDIQLDSLNQLNVLQVLGPKTYLFTRIGVNGDWKGQDVYVSKPRIHPSLERDSVGEIAVAGAVLQPGALAGAASAPKEEVPKLSDRPAGLPTN